jgi:hypothetical protein
MKRIWLFSIICFISLASIQVSVAKPFIQTDGGSISGVVKDEESSAVPAAAVTVLRQDPVSKPPITRLETQTDDEGKFRLDNLPAGLYEVRVGGGYGFRPEAKTNIRVRSSQTTRADFRLKGVRACDGETPKASNVTDADKAEIVRLTFEDALLRKKLPAYYGSLTEGQANLVLSTQNIKPSWVGDLPGHKLVLMSPAEIQRKADTEGDFLYLSFVELKAKGSCVAVTLMNSWAVGKSSSMGYLSGGSVTYEYRRPSGKWIGKWIIGWIS